MGRTSIVSSIVAILAVALSDASGLTAMAQGRATPYPTQQQMLEQLSPPDTSSTAALDNLRRRPTRGAAPSANDTAALEILRRRRTRGFSSYEQGKRLSATERGIVAKASEGKPSLDLVITFALNSDEISEASVPIVETLAGTLKSPQLAGAKIVLGGHTDARGSDAYNQDLSDRRAFAVRKMLIERYGVPEDDLTAMGFGKAQLKNAANPLADENRRVQVVNFLQQ